jgi:arsenate reductase (thioredoxin)
MTNPKRVLILCTGNSARSQMAEGVLRHEAGNQCEAFSAGTQPGLSIRWLSKRCAKSVLISPATGRSR